MTATRVRARVTETVVSEDKILVGLKVAGSGAGEDGSEVER